MYILLWRKRHNLSTTVKKIIIFVSIIGFFLIILIIVFSYLIGLKPQSQQTTSTNQTNLPTLIPITQKTVDLFDKSISRKTTNKIVPEKLINYLPLKNDDFEISYLPKEQKYQIIKKTVQAEAKLNQWINENQLNNIVTINNIIMIDDLPEGGKEATQQNPSELLMDFIDTIFSPYLNTGSGSGNITITPTIINPSEPLSSIEKPTVTISPKKPPTSYNDLLYYSQCSGEFDDYPLPGGCTICKAGCGPTTASMILASYVSQDFNPSSVVDIYKENNYVLGCEGSRYSEAKALFNDNGLKTTDYIIANYEGYIIDEVVDDLKSYIKAGWTIFTLASFKTGGHYFWIVDIDEKNNVLAFDPYYGRLTLPPFNENKYYPFPKYRVAFGVKK